MISVCMATRNGEEYLQDQLDSILQQLGHDDELVISDDSSNDGTVDLVKSFADPRIRLLPDNTFYNPIYNFENAIKHAEGDILINRPFFAEHIIELKLLLELYCLANF